MRSFLRIQRNNVLSVDPSIEVVGRRSTGAMIMVVIMPIMSTMLVVFMPTIRSVLVRHCFCMKQTGSQYGLCGLWWRGDFMN